MTKAADRNLSLVILAAFAMAVFTADLLLPPAVATGVLYAVIVLAGMRFRQRRAIIGLAVISTVLAVLGRVAAADVLTLEDWPVVANRGLAILAIWAVALAVLKQRTLTGALREGEGRYQALIESSPDAIFVHVKGVIILANRQAVTLFGAAAPEALIGRSVFDLIDATSLSLARARTAGMTRPGMRAGLAELTFRRLDGAPFPVEATAAAVLLEGRLAIQALLRDVSARKVAEAALRRSEARLQAIFDTAPDAIIVYDGDGIVESFSPSAEALFGCPAAEVIGHDIRQLVQRPLREVHDGYLGAALRRTGEERSSGIGCAVKGRRKDGSVFPAELGVGVASNGRPHFIGFIRDLTARERMEAQLRQAEKMEAIGQLTGGLAHDFNNLLGVIIGNLDSAMPQVATNGSLNELVAESLAAALSGADLIRRLLAFARQQPLHPACIETNALVESMVRLLDRILGQHIEIKLDLDPDAWRVLADATQLQAAIVNLAANARDAMPRGGRLRIATDNRQLDADYAAAHAEVVAGDFVVIEVSDTGTGMTPEVLKHVFEPFYTTKEQGRGTGLGLSMVFGFIKQSGGHINVHSEPGVGTTFRLYLPRADATATALDEGQPVRSSTGGNETILVVEDNAALRRIAVRLIQTLGYRVLEADSPQAALACLESNPVDLLFTDVVMPGGMDGFALARQAVAQWPTLKVVLTSGFPDLKLNGTVGKSDARLLSKPYRAHELALLLRETFEQQAGC